MTYYSDGYLSNVTPYYCCDSDFSDGYDCDCRCCFASYDSLSYSRCCCCSDYDWSYLFGGKNLFDASCYGCKKKNQIFGDDHGVY